MAADFLYIGSSPTDEDCAQVGAPDYYSQGRAECLGLIAALRKKLGKEPAEAKLFIKREEQDFGAYLEVCCAYDNENKEALDYALKCESDCPSTWAEVGFTREKVLKGEIHD
jgi:hypothetical protein